MASGFGTQLISALAFNVFLRLFTFFLSTWLTRTLLPTQVGINFSYLVYVESIHFLSREAIKNVASRYSIRAQSEGSERQHGNTHNSGRVGAAIKVEAKKTVALLNTAALTIPVCIIVMLTVEMLGAGVFPMMAALWNWFAASPLSETNSERSMGSVQNLAHTTHAAQMVSESVVILPSLCGPMLRAWKASWRLAIESWPYQSSGDIRGAVSLSFWWPLLSTCIRLSIPECLAWFSVVGLALVDPSVALLTSLDLFRTIVIAEGTTMMVRLAFTLVLTKSLLSSTGGGEGRPTALWRLVGNSTPPPLSSAIQDPRYMEAYHVMDQVNKEWVVRLVFASGCIIHAAAMIVFYAIACGSGVRKLRWWLGTAHWCPPLPSRRLSELLRGEGKASIDVLFEEEVMEFSEEKEADHEGEKESLRGPAEKQQTKRTILDLLFPLLVPYVRWPAMRAALRHHRLLLVAFFRESLIRLALSEGTNIALLSVSDAASRGCYQTISRLGALATRLLFRIWENACQAHWSRLAHQSDAKAAVHGLRVMLRLSLYVGFLCSWLGPLYARLVLTVLYSGRWTTIGMVGSLQYYCHTMGPMAWNGLLECFVRAVAQPSLLKQQQVWTVAVSVIYVVSSYVVLLHLRHKQEKIQQQEWVQVVHNYTMQNHTENFSFNKEGMKLKSVEAIERCEDTTVTDVLLILHRVNMLVRICISIGLLLWGKNTAPQTTHSTTFTDCRKREEVDEEVETGGSQPQNVSVQISGRVVSWKDLITIFPLSSSPALACLFIWTRTPFLFPEYLSRKLYMPPFLTILFIFVVSLLDGEMRKALLSVMAKYGGRRMAKEVQ